MTYVTINDIDHTFAEEQYVVDQPPPCCLELESGVWDLLSSSDSNKPLVFREHPFQRGSPGQRLNKVGGFLKQIVSRTSEGEEACPCGTCVPPS